MQSFYDVIVVGAGFAGLYALHKLRRAGFSAVIFEAAPDVGGTWYWNCYPGARCDIQSLVYCYTFDEQMHQEWKWSERCATRSEILKYLNFVADRLTLRQDIRFGNRVTRAVFDQANSWSVTTDQGILVSARYVIMATGALSASRIPGVPGLEDFGGRWYHTGEWPQEGIELSGQRVGIIGTGSSAVQAIPIVAEQARELIVFQRTPAFVAPARNTQNTVTEETAFRANFEVHRHRLRRGEVIGAADFIISDHLMPTRARARDLAPAERRALLQLRWDVGGLSIGRAFADTMVDTEANRVVGDFFREKIREIVKDPRTAELLTPTDYPWGSKRVCLGSNYYETFNRENVTIVDVKDHPIEAFTVRGLRTAEREYSLDTIVLATGFDALTGALTRIEIRGRHDRRLDEVWEDTGPHAFLGLAIAGFPNLFAVNGPGSPGILGNVVVGIEQHVDWIIELLGYARARHLQVIEADPVAEMSWQQHVEEAANSTLFVKGKSWWMKNSGRAGGPVFIPYVRSIGEYRDVCEQIALDDYRGFHLS
jgi:cyclohexanone monooxygenase